MCCTDFSTKTVLSVLLTPVPEDVHLCPGPVHPRHTSCVLGGSGREASRSLQGFVLCLQGFSYIDPCSLSGSGGFTSAWPWCLYFWGVLQKEAGLDSGTEISANRQVISLVNCWIGGRSTSPIAFKAPSHTTLHYVLSSNLVWSFEVM